MKRYAVEIEGKQPLIMHHDNVEWADEMQAWKDDPANKKASKAGDDRTPAFRWLGALYHDRNIIAVPQECLMRCFMEGGIMVPVPGGRSGKTFKAQTQSGMGSESLFWELRIDGDVIAFADLEPLLREPSFAEQKATVQALGFDLFVKRARVGQSKHIRVRPIFHKWTLHGHLLVWDEQITTEILQQILDHAGRFKGLCDWRPGGRTPGPYGVFTASITET